ncbi:MAG: M48 family metallopeptidase, partial [Thermoplasmata archaeon]
DYLLFWPVLPAAIWLATGVGLLLAFRRATSPVLLRLAATFVALWALLATTALVTILSLGGWSSWGILLASPWRLWEPSDWAYWLLGGIGSLAVLTVAFSLNQIVGRGLLYLLGPTRLAWPERLGAPPARTRLYSYRSDRLDAFSFTILGGNRRHLVQRSEVILLSDGLLHCLTPEETEAVIAHELGHIRDLDARYVTFFRTLSHMMRWDPVLAYLAWAITRREEYRADLAAARATRNPQALARALLKVIEAPGPSARSTAVVALLGFGGRRGHREALLRIERLLELAESPEYRELLP